MSNDLETLQRELWFVDVRGKVHPMSTSNILKSLTTGELNIYNRVSKDKTNWNAICNEAHIEEVVRLSIQILSSQNLNSLSQDEDAGSQQSGSLGFDLENVGKEINQQLELARKMGEVTLDLTKLRKVLAEILTNRKSIVVEDLSEKEATIHPDDMNKVVVIGTPTQRKDKRVSQPLYYLLGFVAFLALAIYGALSIDLKEKKDPAEERRKKINSDYQSALSSVRGQFGSKKSDQGITEYVKSMIPGNAESGTTKEDTEAESDDYISYHNDGIDRLNKNKLEESETLLLHALELRWHDKGATILGLFEVAWKLDLAAGTTDRVRAIQGLLDEPKTLRSQFLSQIRLAKLVSLWFIKDAGFVTALRVYLDEIPKNEDIVFSQSGENFSRAQWNKIYSWCNGVTDKDAPKELKYALTASCLLRAGMQSSALTYADYAYKVNPRDPLVAGLYYFTLISNEKWNEAKKILVLANTEALPASKLLTHTFNEVCKYYPNEALCPPNPERIPSAIESPVLNKNTAKKDTPLTKAK